MRVAQSTAPIIAAALIGVMYIPVGWGILAVAAASMYAVVLRWQYSEAHD